MSVVVEPMSMNKADPIALPTTEALANQLADAISAMCRPASAGATKTAPAAENGTAGGGPIVRLALGEGLRQPLKTEAKRRGNLHRVDDAAVLGPRRLQVRAADIPSDHHRHRAVPY